MKLRQSFLPVLILTLASTFFDAQDAAALTPSRAPAVTTDALERLISRNKLLAHAEQFFSFAQLSNGNRAFGSEGHEATIHYIKRLLDETGYYDVEFQTFTYPYAEARSQLTVDGKDLFTSAFTYSPGGDVTAPLAVVSNVGCQAVRIYNCDHCSCVSHVYA
jgi:hypothetical protein